MYQKPDYGQTAIYNFILLFGGHLDENNRWVILRKSIDWKVIHEVYEKNFDNKETGNPALSAEIAFGSLYIQRKLSHTDRELVEQISENPYMQYFIGFKEFRTERPFEESITKRTTIYFVIILCVVLLCSCIGIIIRNTYVGYTSFEQMENKENLQEYYVRVTEEDDQFVAIEKYDDLEGTADVIAKVSATDKRRMFPHTTTLTEVVVVETYKGKIESGQSIFIYELAVFSYSVSKSYRSSGGYQMMKQGEEYIVFLQKLKTAKGYKMSEKEKNTFLPTTALFSKFPMQQGIVELMSEKKINNGKYCYANVKNLEIITSEKENLEKYVKIKEEVLRRYQ